MRLSDPTDIVLTSKPSDVSSTFAASNDVPKFAVMEHFGVFVGVFLRVPILDQPPQVRDAVRLLRIGGHATSPAEAAALINKAIASTNPS